MWVCFAAVMAVLPAYKPETSEDSLGLEDWLRLAEQGHTFSMYVVASLYGDREEYDKVIHWYTTAAELGNALAQVDLAAMYFEGRHVEQNYATAAQWYRRAATNGSATAQHNLSLMLFNGQGVTQDSSKAFMWLAIAAMQPIDQYKRQLAQLRTQLTPAQLQVAELYIAECVQQRYQNC